MKRASLYSMLIIVLCFFTSSSAEAVARPNKAIIIAGSGPLSTGSEWDTVADLSNYTYTTLNALYFNDAEIQYLSADSNSTDKTVDGYADLQGLETAVTQWAADANDVILYMAGNGQSGTFKINDSELLGANTLDQWITVLQSKIPGRVTIIYDANYSGSFIPDLNKPGRTIITSSQPDHLAYYGSNGPKSFTRYFFSGIVIGKDVIGGFGRAASTIHYYSWSSATKDKVSPYIRDGRHRRNVWDISGHILGGLKYFIEPGHNAISVSGHMYTAESLAKVINENGGSVTAVSKWDGKKYVEYIVGTNKGDYYIEPGVAYYINAGKSSEWFVPRDKVACQKHNFDKGSNLVGFPEGTGHTASSLTEALAKKGHSVKYIKDLNQLQTYYPGSSENDFQIIPGDGYIVYASHEAAINTCQ